MGLVSSRVGQPVGSLFFFFFMLGRQSCKPKTFESFHTLEVLKSDVRNVTSGRLVLGGRSPSGEGSGGGEVYSYFRCESF